MVFRNTLANLFRNLKSFFKGGRGGRVNDLSSQSVVKFGSLIKKTENCLMLVKQKGKCRAWEFLVLQIISSSAIDNNFT